LINLFPLEITGRVAQKSICVYRDVLIADCLFPRKQDCLPEGKIYWVIMKCPWMSEPT